MKKSTTFLYLALLLGIIISSCTPCDDGDPAESNSVETNQNQVNNNQQFNS